MNLIVAADEKWAIGYKNSLLVRIPEDQKMFRQMTTGGAVIMGRKTLESFPGKRPLPNRLNVVITHDTGYKVSDAVVVHSIEEALAAVKEYEDDKIFVIGGETIYRQMLDMCSTAYVTKIDYTYEADAYFPNLDEAEGWKLISQSEERTYFDLTFHYLKYERA